MGKPGVIIAQELRFVKGGVAFFSKNIYNRGVTRAYGRYGTVRCRGAGVTVPCAAGVQALRCRALLGCRRYGIVRCWGAGVTASCVAGAVRSVLRAVGRGAVPRVVVVQGAVPCAVGADRALFYFFPAT